MARLVSNEASFILIDDDVIDSISRYLDVLIDLYPVPLSQKELADFSSVSPSAVSKIKEKLFPYCNVETLAFTSKLVLNLNSDLFTFYINKKNRERNLIGVIRLLSTVYAEEIINQFGVYDYFTSQISDLSDLFTEDEINLVIRFILRLFRSNELSYSDEENIISAFEKIKDHNLVNEDILNNMRSFISGSILNTYMESISFDWHIITDDDLIVILTTRDKFYYIFKYLILEYIKILNIENIFTEDEATSFKILCNKIMIYYMNIIFENLSLNIREYLFDKNIIYNDSYDEIGLLSNEEVIFNILNSIKNEYLEET